MTGVAYARAYQDACAALAASHRDLAELRAGELRARAQLFRTLNDGTRNITAIREQITYEASQLSIEIIKVEGEIAALNAELRWLDYTRDVAVTNAVDGWVDLSDFTPGIHGDIHGGVANASRGSIIGKNGAATIDGTYRCGVDAYGSLVPLPAATIAATSELLPKGNARGTTAYYPPNMIAAYLVDAVTMGPWATGFAWPDDRKDLQGQVLHTTAWWFMYTPAGGSAAYRSMYLGRMYTTRTTDATVSTFDFMWESSNPVSYNSGHQIASMSLTAGRDDTPVDKGGLGVLYARNPHNTVVATISAYLTHDISHTIPTDEQDLSTYRTDMSFTQPSSGLVYGNKYPRNFGGSQGGFMLVFPQAETYDGDASNDVGIQNAAYDLPLIETLPDMMVQPKLSPEFASNGQQYGSEVRFFNVTTHQGRVAAIAQSLKSFGPRGQLRVSFLAYTRAWRSARVFYRNEYLYGENNSDLMLIASLNVDELLFIRNSDGGVLVRGDVDNPTVVRLRNLESMYGVTHAPINSRIGLVYGSPNGIFVYQGGEVTPRISEQLDGFFWNHVPPGEPEYEAQRGRFGTFDRWVAVPNNFVYDTRAQSWWRIANPADRAGVAYNCYTADPTSGDMYAFPHKLTTTQNVVCDRYARETLAGSYTWRSQPLIETLERTRSFQEAMIVASPGVNTAECNVTLSLTGFDEDGDALAPVVIPFTFVGSGSGTPVIVRTRFPSFNAMYVQLHISASAITGAAPKLHSVRLGFGERARAPQD